MSVDRSEKDFATYVVDMMQSIGPVYSKRMFGGYGLFIEGLMFGLIADNTLYFKADETTVSCFEQKGLGAFGYQKQDKTVYLSYFQAPEETLEDTDVMREWANQAYATALRVAEHKHQ